MNTNNCDCKVIKHDFKQWQSPIPEKVINQEDDCQLIIIDCEDRISFV